MSMLAELIHQFNTADAAVQRRTQEWLRSQGQHEAADMGAAFEGLAHHDGENTDHFVDLNEMVVRTCEGCGCTDDDACEDADTGVACFWVADYDGDLCSACARTMQAINESRRVEVYSPHEAQDFIERTRAARIGVSA